MFCRECGKKIEDGTKYCTYCGTKILPIGELSKINLEKEDKEVKEEIKEIEIKNEVENKEETKNETEEKDTVITTCKFDVKDKPNFFLNVASFFAPVIGIIVYLKYNEKAPKKAKSSLTTALVGAIVSLLFKLGVVLVYVAYVLDFIFSMNTNTNVKYKYNDVLNDDYDYYMQQLF